MEEKIIEMPLKSAEDTKNYIMALADAAFGSRHLTPDERAVVEHGAHQLNLGFSMLDSSDHEILQEAARLLMLGAFKIVSHTVVSNSMINYRNAEKHSPAGQKGRNKAVLQAEEWRRHVRKRTAEIHRTAIRNLTRNLLTKRARCL